MEEPPPGLHSEACACSSHTAGPLCGQRSVTASFYLHGAWARVVGCTEVLYLRPGGWIGDTLAFFNDLLRPLLFLSPTKLPQRLLGGRWELISVLGAASRLEERGL